MKTIRMILPVALLIATACNLGQITDTSGPDDTVSQNGIGSGWTGGAAGTGGGGGGGDDSHPLVGEWVWSTPTCALSPAIRLTLSANLTGTIQYADCDNSCPGGQIGGFRWVASGLSSGSLQLNYTGLTICGAPANTPAPDSKNFSFSGPNLVWAGVTWTKAG